MIRRRSRARQPTPHDSESRTIYVSPLQGLFNGGDGAGSYTLVASHVADDGLLVLDFVGYPPVRPALEPGHVYVTYPAMWSEKVQVAAKIPKLANVPGIRVRTVYGKSREAWLP